MNKPKLTFNKETFLKKHPKYTIKEIEKKAKNLFLKTYFPENEYDNYMNYIMEVLVFNKNCHLVTIFKDYMILDYIDEFLKRYYINNESKDRIPKFANFYKNYLKFFCKPTFSDFECNEIIQEHSEKKAELYYNQNFRNKNDKNFDDGLFEDEESSNSYQVSKSKIEKTIFNETIKKQIDENSEGTINLQSNDFIPNQSYLYTKYSSEVSLLNIMNAINGKKKDFKNKKFPQPKIHHYLSNSGNSKIKHSKLLSYTSLCQKKSIYGLKKNSILKDSTNNEKNNHYTKSQINFNWKKSRNQNNSMSNQNIHSLTKNDSKYKTFDLFNNNINSNVNLKKGINLIKTQNVENLLNKLQRNGSLHRNNIYSIDNLLRANKISNKKNVSSTSNIPLSKKNNVNNNIYNINYTNNNSIRKQNNSHSKNKVHSPISSKNSIISRNSKFPSKKIPISHTVTNFSNNNNNNNNNEEIMKITLAAILMNNNKNNIKQSNHHHRINSSNINNNNTNLNYNNKQIQNVNININNQINISNNQIQDILSSKLNNKLNINEKIDMNIHNNINNYLDEKTKKFSRNKGRNIDINTNSQSPPPLNSVNHQNSIYRSCSNIDKKILTSTMSNFHNLNTKSPKGNKGKNNKVNTNKLIKSIEKIKNNDNYYLKGKIHIGNIGYKKLGNKRASSKN